MKGLHQMESYETVIRDCIYNKQKVETLRHGANIGTSNSYIYRDMVSPNVPYEGHLI